MKLQKGQRSALSQLGIQSNFEVLINITGLSTPIDFACFALNAEQKLVNDDYMIFFNQRRSPCQAIELVLLSDNNACYSCQLNKLPAQVNRFVFTATVENTHTLHDIQSGYIQLRYQQQVLAEFKFNSADFVQEKAVILIEFYRKQNEWRMNTVCQGFNGGLAALVTHFGAEVSDTPPVKSTDNPPIPEKISLNKIILEKKGDKISLAKAKNANGFGRIVCNLNWNKTVQPVINKTNETKKGLFNKVTDFFTDVNSTGFTKKAIDLDLACLYELSNGDKFVIQALGNHFGKYDTSPYIYLAGDDRTGESSEGEFLYINGDYLQQIRRICIFAFIYEGAVNWAQADAFVTVTVPNQPVIEVRVNSTSNFLRCCAIAMLENENGSLKLTKLDEYFSGHQELDRHYHWGMNWVKGTKN
jgi:tellurite resistance protein TerA